MPEHAHRNRVVAREVKRGIITVKHGVSDWITDAEADPTVPPRDLRFAKRVCAILLALAGVIDTWGNGPFSTDPVPGGSVPPPPTD